MNDIQHPDDAAVDRFATAMKAKMAASRAKGRSGWDDPDQCPADRLRMMMRTHIGKGDPVDVANFCMMLWNRGESTTMPIDSDLRAAPTPVTTAEQPVRNALQSMVDMMDAGDEPGAGSAWHQQAVAALKGGAA